MQFLYETFKDGQSRLILVKAKDASHALLKLAELVGSGVEPKLLAVFEASSLDKSVFYRVS